MGKRLFIAVDINEATRAQVGGISAYLREALGSTKASWVRPDRMHLTLHFFGDADERIEQRARNALAHPITEAPVNVSFSGVGTFPERGSARVVWLGVAEGVPQLRRLQHALVAGEETRPTRNSSGRSFSPHLTLARLRDRAPREKIAEITRIPASAGPSRIDRVTLYESRLSPAGPTYVSLAEAPLAGPG